MTAPGTDDPSLIYFPTEESMERRKPKVNKSKLWDCSWVSESLPKIQSMQDWWSSSLRPWPTLIPTLGKPRILSTSHRIQTDEICFPCPHLPGCNALDLLVFLCLWFPHYMQFFNQTLLHLVEIQRMVQKGGAHKPDLSLSVVCHQGDRSCKDPLSLLPVTQWLLLLSVWLWWDQWPQGCPQLGL